MKLKTKFHLTLVILITIANSIFGNPIFEGESAKALQANLDIKNQAMYNRNISNIYNNINIKYISIKLYDKYININNININNKITKIKRSLSFKEKTEILMYSIKQVESHGRYNAKSKWSSACGAYQYMPITWNNYQGFKTACLAPERVQDARMRGEVKYLWKKYGDWDKVIAAHYMPAYAGNKKLWYHSAGGLSVREYVQRVNDSMHRVVVGLATT
jgi:hypothetical protein